MGADARKILKRVIDRSSASLRIGRSVAELNRRRIFGVVQLAEGEEPGSNILRFVESSRPVRHPLAGVQFSVKSQGRSPVGDYASALVGQRWRSMKQRLIIDLLDEKVRHVGPRDDTQRSSRARPPAFYSARCALVFSWKSRPFLVGATKPARMTKSPKRSPLWRSLA